MAETPTGWASAARRFRQDAERKLGLEVKIEATFEAFRWRFLLLGPGAPRALRAPTAGGELALPAAGAGVTSRRAYEIVHQIRDILYNIFVYNIYIYRIPI